MTSEPVPNPDPAELPPDDVREEFLESLADYHGDDDGVRLAERARLVLSQRPLAPDAQGFAVALVDWAIHKVLGVLDGRAAPIPRASSWEDLKVVQRELGSLVAELEEARSSAYGAGGEGPSDEVRSRAWAARELADAVRDLLRIPKYRLTDPGWKSKAQRPTPLSLCQRASGNVVSAWWTAIDVAPDAEWAVDRLGLAPDQDADADRSARSRRALTSIGMSEPSARLVAFAEALCAIIDVSAAGDPAALVRRALDAGDEPAARIAAEDPVLRGRPLAAPAGTVEEAAQAVVLDVGRELVDELRRTSPVPVPRAATSSASTPVEPPVARATADDLAARLTRALNDQRKKPLDALSELRRLGDEVSADARTQVIDAIIRATLDNDESYAHILDQERLRIGAIDGPLLIALRPTRGSTVHLWRSETGANPEAPEFAEALCGNSLDRGGLERLTGPPSMPRSGSDTIVGYLYGRTVCSDCERAAREAGMLAEHGAVPAADIPGELVYALTETVLRTDVDDDEMRDWHLRHELRSTMTAFARRAAVADAMRIGDACAQRILGPERYRRERGSFTDSAITRLLTEEDWQQIAAAEPRSLPRRLLDCAKDRQLVEGYTGRGGTAGWDTFFEALRSYHELHGHTRVPRGFITADVLKLGYWLRNQRQAFRGAPGRKLTTEQHHRLHDLDERWYTGEDPEQPPRTTRPRSTAPPVPPAPRGRTHLRLVDTSRADDEQRPAQPQRPSANAAASPSRKPAPPAPTAALKVTVWKGSRAAGDRHYKTYIARQGEQIVFSGSSLFDGRLRLDEIELRRVLAAEASAVHGAWHPDGATGPQADTTEFRAEVEGVELRLFDGHAQRFTVRVRELGRVLARLEPAG